MWKLFFNDQLQRFGGPAIFNGNINSGVLPPMFCYFGCLYDRNLKDIVGNK